MSERNSCTYCRHEKGTLSDGSTGPWCDYFSEPIMGFDQRFTDHYAGLNTYKHSGRALGHQAQCPGFSLDPKMQAAWTTAGFGASAPKAGARAGHSATGAVLGLGSFILRAFLAIVLPVVLLAVLGMAFGGDDAGLLAGSVVSLIICVILAFRWKAMGGARFFLVATPLLITFLAMSTV